VKGPRLFGVYTAQFPFLEVNATKLRPVIVVSKPQSKHGTIVIIPISSSAKEEPVDVMLKDWSSAGLVRPSVARVHRLVTMLQTDIVAELGVLAQSDIQALQDALRLLLNL